MNKLVAFGTIAIALAAPAYSQPELLWSFDTGG